MAINVKYCSADGATQIGEQAWGQWISDIAEVDATPAKFALENIDARAVGASPFSGIELRIKKDGLNDGDAFYYTASDPNGTLSRPWGPAGSAPSAAVAAGGGAWVYSGTGDKGVVVTAYSAHGETPASDEQSFTITDPFQTATYTWVKQSAPAPIGYRVYRRDGATGALGLIAQVLQSAPASWDDDGSVLPGAPPPTDNRTAANATAYDPYGEPPATENFTKTAKAIASAPAGLAIGQQWFWYSTLKIPAGTDATGNTRVVRIEPTEFT